MPHHRQSNLQLAYNADAENRLKAQHVSVHEIRELADSLGIKDVDHKTKEQLARALARRKQALPKMSKDDDECASRFTDLSREDVVDLAMDLDLDVNERSAKVDACHALHKAGIKNQEMAMMVMAMQRSEEVPASRPVSQMPKVLSGVPDLLRRPSDVPDLLRRRPSGVPDLLRRPSSGVPDLLRRPSSGVPDLSDVNNLLGKKCRRSKVGKHYLLRDKKGRFCKKSSKRRGRK